MPNPTRPLRTRHFAAGTDDPMPAPSQFTIAGDVCKFFPAGAVSLVSIVDMVTAAILFCRDNKVPKLLVDLRAVEGIESPTLAERFWMAQDWAEAAQGAVALAIVPRAEHIDPGKFGAKAAADMGLKGDVFTSEAAAWRWLTGEIDADAG